MNFDLTDDPPAVRQIAGCALHGDRPVLSPAARSQFAPNLKLDDGPLKYMSILISLILNPLGDRRIEIPCPHRRIVVRGARSVPAAT